jgi:hypothetical protein
MGPECLAGVRGFELTHSRSNPVSARAFANLGIWLGRPPTVQQFRLGKPPAS